LNEADIAERFIRAAEVERAMPVHVGPMPPRSVQLPYVHDWVDKMGWAKTRGDKLKEDPLAEERRIFWERMGLRASAQEIAQLEHLREWLLAVPDEGERRALLAWAMSKAGGRKFNRWCFKVEGIHPETGRRRKNRAIARILARFDRNGGQDCNNPANGVLPETPENDHDPATIAEDVSEPRSPRSWMSDDAFAPFLSEGPFDFSWAEKRNEIRRQREARRRKLAEKLAKSG